jgi:hypothetical protein
MIPTIPTVPIQPLQSLRHCPSVMSMFRLYPLCLRQHLFPDQSFTPRLSSIESPHHSSPALQSALPSMPHQIVFATLKRLSNITVPPGSNAETRILQQFANGTIQMEVSCGNIDYRLQLSPSEVLQLYEQTVKRPP